MAIYENPSQETATSKDSGARRFFRGVSRAFDLTGSTSLRQLPYRSDQAATAQDWAVVGRDIGSAVTRFERQHARLKA